MARTKAAARAARPASCAPMTEAPCGSADVSATARVRAVPVGRTALTVGFGSSVGNSPAAFPLGLSVGFAAGMLGRLATGSGEVTTVETRGA